MARVTVLGSLHYDILVRAPDRPRKGETLTGQSWTPKCGGKGGNQAIAAARAGVKAAMIGAVGDDFFAQVLLRNLRSGGVGTKHVRIVPDSESGMSVAIFDSSNDYGAVIVSGANLTLNGGDVDTAADLIGRSDIIVLQNEIPEATNLAAAQLAHAKGVTVILNAAPVRPLAKELVGLIDILVVNSIEAGALGGIPVLDALDGAVEAAKRLALQFAVAIVTAGSAGVAAATANGEVIVIKGIKVDVISTHGAGDAFVGTLSASLANGDPLKKALHLSNIEAARTVSSSQQAPLRPGSSP